MPEVVDYALVEGTIPDTVVAHRADCPDVRVIAALGMPVATLLGCAHPLPPDIERAACLEASE